MKGKYNKVRSKCDYALWKDKIRKGQTPRTRNVLNQERYNCGFLFHLHNVKYLLDKENTAIHISHWYFFSSCYLTLSPFSSVYTVIKKK